LVAGLLLKSGHEVTAVDTAGKVLAAMEQSRFDVLLMDTEMPDLDALETAAAIRAREKETGRRMAIIAMTARALPGDRRRFLEAGMDDYISQPIRADRLRSALQTALARTARPASGDGQPPPPEEEIDWDEAYRSVKGDAGLLKVVIEAALEECPRLMAEIQRAVAQEDAEALCFAAHKFKGALRYFGAARAFEIAFRLEQMGRNKNLAGAGALVSALSGLAASIVAALANSPGSPLKNSS
jgi:CheY-like chemotaxis protein/HPt (histidine-containing phosphotransfer) domain-containing protein